MIFLESGTHNIWYKNSMCNAGVVAMGFSLSRLTAHPNAIPMETYFDIFVKANDDLEDHPLITIPKIGNIEEWMKRNDFEFVE